jgi:hypothetical protein
MKWLLRPSGLIVLLVFLVVGAAAWIYQSTQVPSRPVPLPVHGEDYEIAWLNSATGSTAWQRFVQAVADVTGSEPGPETFPRQTTSVPEFVASLPGSGTKLRFRWYKLTSEWDAEYWIEALTRRDPPPLAVIGGSTTDAAAQQARWLRSQAQVLPEERRPLLLLTTATADRVKLDREEQASHPDGIPLLDLYPGRTFRFCFSNQQIGSAVTGFIWGHPDLRPDAFPVYAVEWEDDPYSQDLINGFLGAMSRRATFAMASAWGVGAGLGSTGGFPLGVLNYANVMSPDALYPLTRKVLYSVGSFERPNRYEAWAALDILDNLGRHARQKHAMLVLSGQSQPSRRFVRAMCRLSPIRTRRFVLASGDSISFNTILRDRNVTWPIQDLPCSLVLFCHQNPAGELQAGRAETASGTEDLFLYREIIRALIVANTCEGRRCDHANRLRDRLRRLHLGEEGPRIDGPGPLLFDEAGNRRSGTGEHVVWLRPSFDGERALPEATINVNAWDPGRNAFVPRGKPLRVTYTGARDR